MHVLGENGQFVTDEVGEMVVTQPMPSMPVGFWNDRNDERYTETYFSDFPGMWRQGDFYRINERGGVFVLGRSDATLNRHGIRIGTSEIYRTIVLVPGVEDGLIVNLDLPGGKFFMPLFVKLAEGRVLDEALVKAINDRLRAEYTPRHVPDKIYQVPAIPYTISGKRMEVPVRRILAGVPIAKAANRDAMANPKALDPYIEYAREATGLQDLMSNTVHVDELIDRQQLTGRNYFVLALLLMALVCDGFDLQLVGVAAPWLTEAWGVKPSELVGPVQSANLFGMMLGAIFLGGLGDRIGRKRIIVGGVFLFGAMTLAALLTSNVTQLAIVRFLTGIGLGGVLPNVIALTARDNAAAQARDDDQLRHPRHVAGQRAAGRGRGEARAHARLGIAVHRRRPRSVVIGLLLAIFLPESLLFHDEPRPRPRSSSRVACRSSIPQLPITADTTFALRGAGRGGRGSFRELFTPGLRVTTPMLWIMFAGVLMAMHFLNSWISTVLKLGNLSAQQFSLTNSVFHWSGAIATIFTALLLGRLGLRWVVVLLLIGLGSLLSIATFGFASAAVPDAGRVPRGLRRDRLPGGAQCLGGTHLSVQLPHHRRGCGAGDWSRRITGRPADRRLRAQPGRAGAADVLRAADSAGTGGAGDRRAVAAQGGYPGGRRESGTLTHGIGNDSHTPSVWSKTGDCKGAH